MTMKHVQILAVMLMATLVCISASPVPASLQESSSSSPPNTTQLPDSDLLNSTSFEMAEKFSFESSVYQDLPRVYNGVGGCSLSTCVIHNLGPRLSSGDETAGSSTSDSEGFGKK